MCPQLTLDSCFWARSDGGNGSYANSAAQQRSKVPPGTHVLVVQKQHQRSGELTRGTVARNLTNSASHPRGQKVGFDKASCLQRGSIMSSISLMLDIQKQHQRRSELTRGIVARNLTNSASHPCGQKAGFDEVSYFSASVL